jgi:selT/selW/selH-like putative selenoprotein
LAKALKDRYNVDAELIRSSGGVFEVVKDGQLIFSKRAKGRFPEDSEIYSIIDAGK